MAKGSILMVEDSQTEATFLTECLKKSGYEVLNVTTAEAAKAMLETKNFDVILIDVVLPGQSGYSLCRELKNQKNTANIPIIICSSKSEKIDKKWGMKQGASAYVTKPVDQEKLVATLEKLVV
ncbi:MAG: response regulator [Trichodesmium sp. St16_bin4-tuft]|nr:response regulator [Trichodesmium sp. St4_bin8_1]MDE5072574.1 response regulator [Trichodesmium sp. St5_bin8]MDE5078790.1 response regulator [Trichodesmium sp. St2_bin6]MDE5101136.1 response regulator [Trichodesmium sp. St16_bin4-tuft]MDE5102292.1 response regulator [Trichodesmium sp. St19_bin2]